MQTLTQTLTIRPEVSYGCPWCSTLFGHKRWLIKHIKTCEAREDRQRIKIKFLKPK